MLAAVAILAATPVDAQFAARPPELIARQFGGEECRPVGSRAPTTTAATPTVVGRFASEGSAVDTYTNARFVVEACFADIVACERFINEMRFDYPYASGGECRPLARPRG